jgi:hypothetical protein
MLQKVFKPKTFSVDPFAIKVENIIYKNRRLLQQKSICSQTMQSGKETINLNYNKTYNLFTKFTNDYNKKSIY